MSKLKSLRNAAGMAALTLGMISFAGGANAFNIDFLGNGDSVAGAGSPQGERAIADGGTIVFGDVTVVLSATWTGGPANAYIDAGGAGLGVCHTLDGNSNPTACAGTADDNVTVGEAVTLTFKDTTSGNALTDVTLSGLRFKDQNHGTIWDGGFVRIDDGGGGGFTDHDFFNGSVNLVDNPSFTGMTFTFAHNSGPFNDFYLSGLTLTVNDTGTPGVPEPATLALFGFGLAGMRYVQRRRSA